MRARFQVLVEVLRSRDLRRVAFAFTCFSLAEHATWLAIMVYAFQNGGVTEAGIATFVQLAPAALLAPLLAVAGDRMPRQRYAAIGFGAQALANAATAAAMLLDAHSFVVYGFATVAAITVTMSRPAVAAALPALASTPSELTAANVSIGFVETVGLFVGPAIGGLFLIDGSPDIVFVAGAVLLTLATLATVRVRPTGSVVHVDDPEEPLGIAHVLSGISMLRKEPDPRFLVGMLCLTYLLAGALDVAFVVVAVDLLQESEASAGLLASMNGLGSIVGATLAVALVGRRHLTQPLALGVVLAGVPIAALAFDGGLALAGLLMFASGAGTIIAEIAGRTLLQGLAADDVLARIFGALEGLSMAGMAAGGLIFAVLAEVFGLELALILLGASLPVAVALRFGRLLNIDRNRPAVDETLLGFLRDIPIFAPLPPYGLEQVLANMQRTTTGPGEAIMVLGEVGEELHVVASGYAIVQLPDGGTYEARPGDYVGEIALLNDVPRTATVVAGPGGLDSYVLRRDEFLEAVTGYPRSFARASGTAARRLAEQDDPAEQHE